MRNLSVLFVIACAGCTPTHSAAPPPSRTAPTPSRVAPTASVHPPTVSSKKTARFDDADVVVIATLNTPRITGVLEVSPPIYQHEFGLDAPRVLFGTNVTAGARVTFESRTASSAFEAGKPMVVAMRRVQATLPSHEEQLQALEVLPATRELEAAAAGNVLPSGLALSVRQVPPASHIQYQNDYGDGLFELEIENRGNTRATVPGLTEENGKVAWANALTVVDDTGRRLHLSGSASVKGKPVELAPGGKVSTRLDVKPFGLVSPAGGYRAYYSFRIEEMRVTSFFYYFASLHGPQMGKVRAPTP